MQFPTKDTMVTRSGQAMTGAWVSTTVTVWLQVLLLPQSSVTSQFWVMNFGQTPCVTILPTVIAILAPQQLFAVGRSNAHLEPQATVLSGAQLTARQAFVKHCTVTVKLHLVLPTQLEVTQITVVVVPGVKVLPDGGVQTTVRLLLQKSVAFTV